jgi:hypothetical protein
MTRVIVVAVVVISVVTFLMTTAAGVAHAQGLRIKVRGSAKITARAARDQGELVLSGTLTDDAGQPLVGKNLTARVTREADPADPRVAEGVRAARGCDRSADRPRPQMAFSVQPGGTPQNPEVLLATDEDGRFCFRVKLDPDRFVAHLHWRDKNAGSLLEQADQEVAFDLSRRALALSFDPKPKIVPLDQPQSAFDAVAIVDDDATPRVAPNLSLLLSSEKKELRRMNTDASGRAHFVVASSDLGPPGPGELHVTFAGDGETAKAHHVEAIERHVKVAVRVPAIEQGKLEPQVPEDGIAIVAEVTSVVGPVSEGAVEAHVGDVVVGAAPVERGIARLTLTFAAQGSETLVALRYVPVSPWYEPLPDPTVRIPIRGPGVLAKAPILVAGLAVLVFFLVGRVSSNRAKAAPPALEKSDDEARDGKPKLEVVRSAARGDRGWNGRVVDAHEGHPIPNARVWVERGTFEGRSVLSSVSTDARGEFTLPALASQVGDETIACEAPLHARFSQTLPGPGELSIALALRRRALLARMVKWAKRRGTPFDVRPEPTPGHVRRAAGDDRTTAKWADAVEQAVFGGGEVDARLEKEIEALAPDKTSAQQDDLDRRE